MISAGCSVLKLYKLVYVSWVIVFMGVCSKMYAWCPVEKVS